LVFGCGPILPAIFFSAKAVALKVRTVLSWKKVARGRSCVRSVENDIVLSVGSGRQQWGVKFEMLRLCRSFFVTWLV
jgi:hypothetical protein